MKKSRRQWLSRAKSSRWGEFTVFEIGSAKIGKKSIKLEIRFFGWLPKRKSKKFINETISKAESILTAERINNPELEDYNFHPKFIGWEKAPRKRKGYALWIKGSKPIKSSNWIESKWRTKRIGLDWDGITRAELNRRKKQLKEKRIKFSVSKTKKGYHAKLKVGWRNIDKAIKKRYFYKDDIGRIHYDRSKQEDDFEEAIDTLFDWKVKL